jgi:LuxR family transcriptional regulator, quorum-sensing system regulator SdiA
MVLTGLSMAVQGFRNGTNLGDPEEFLVLSNHDPEYIEYFIDEERYLDSPMFRWSYDNVGCASWSAVAKLAINGKLTSAEMEVVRRTKAWA